jgi:hypothetical protein
MTDLILARYCVASVIGADVCAKGKRGEDVEIWAGDLAAQQSSTCLWIKSISSGAPSDPGMKPGRCGLLKDEDQRAPIARLAHDTNH